MGPMEQWHQRQLILFKMIANGVLQLDGNLQAKMGNTSWKAV